MKKVIVIKRVYIRVKHSQQAITSISAYNSLNLYYLLYFFKPAS